MYRPPVTRTLIRRPNEAPSPKPGVSPPRTSAYSESAAVIKGPATRAKTCRRLALLEGVRKVVACHGRLHVASGSTKSVVGARLSAAGTALGAYYLSPTLRHDLIDDESGRGATIDTALHDFQQYGLRLQKQTLGKFVCHTFGTLLLEVCISPRTEVRGWRTVVPAALGLGRQQLPRCRRRNAFRTSSQWIPRQPVVVRRRAPFRAAIVRARRSGGALTSRCWPDHSIVTNVPKQSLAWKGAVRPRRSSYVESSDYRTPTDEAPETMYEGQTGW